MGFIKDLNIFYISFVSIIICFSNVAVINAQECHTPTKEDKETTTFCFFSLNNAKEKTLLEQKINAVKKKNADIKIEVREFYGESNSQQSTEQQFKKMIKTSECDALVISGNHVGFFGGRLSRSSKNNMFDQALSLDFLEKLSCKVTSKEAFEQTVDPRQKFAQKVNVARCIGWFSNVKSVFLQGSDTVKTTENLNKHLKTADIRTSNMVRDKYFSANEFKAYNQAYSSTLDTNNKLSHRYLRMFPKAHLYGWGGQVPGETDLPKQLIKFIQQFDPPNNESETLTTDQINNFINNMGSFKNNAAYNSTNWINSWSSGEPTACYIKDDTEQANMIQSHKNGCALTAAIKSQKSNTNDIKQAIDNILTDSKDKDSVAANLNYLISLVTSKENKNKDWYEDIIEHLKTKTKLKNTIIKQLKAPQLGFVRKFDYLFVYHALWGSEDINTNKKISEQILQHLHPILDKTEELDRIAITHKQGEPITIHLNRNIAESIFAGIVQNKDLTKWLYKNAQDEFKKVANKFIQSKNTVNQVLGYGLQSSYDLINFKSYKKHILDKISSKELLVRIYARQTVHQYPDVEVFKSIINNSTTANKKN